MCDHALHYRPVAVVDIWLLITVYFRYYSAILVAQIINTGKRGDQLWNNSHSFDESKRKYKGATLHVKLMF